MINILVFFFISFGMFVSLIVNEFWYVIIFLISRMFLYKVSNFFIVVFIIFWSIFNLNKYMNMGRFFLLEFYTVKEVLYIFKWS